jgi:hypothetical protein
MVRWTGKNDVYGWLADSEGEGKVVLLRVGKEAPRRHEAVTGESAAARRGVPLGLKNPF